MQFYASFLGAFMKLRKADYWLCHVCPSARMEQLGSNWTDFHDIGYLSVFFRKFAQKIQVSLKSDNNNFYFTCRPIYIRYCTSRSCLVWMRNVSNSGLPLYGIPQSRSFRHTTLDRSPLDERSARCSFFALQHTTLTRNKHPCRRWDLNPQSQQPSDRRYTP
jgi:hypothetical protein